MEQPTRLPRLSSNGSRLIRKLSELPPVWFTAAALGESVGVSRRTVMRELPGMEKWLAAAGFRLVRSPGQGIRLEEDESRRAALRALLDGGQTALSRRERIDRLIALLFAEGGPVKTAYLAHQLQISEHTLSGDLDAAAAWLLARGVTLVRRAGVGVWLEGSPENLRRAIGVRLRPQLAQVDWRRFLSDRSAASPLELLDRDDMAAVVGVLQDWERKGRFCFSDSAFLSLVLHITLLAGQVRNQPLSQTAPTRQPGELLAALEQALGIRLPDGEAAYLDHCLQAACGKRDWDDPSEIHLQYLASVLIQGMERETGVELTGFSTLRDDLCAHLRPMLVRIQRGERIENPQLEPMRTQYPALWQAMRRVCDQAGQAASLPEIPDEEACFLAMHFGAVLEECERTRRRLRAVVVCPMGMATSRFLTSQLDREVPEITVERMCPMRGLDTDALRREGIDLIISTVPLQADLPHIVVGAVLQEKDRIQLRGIVEAFRARPDAPPRTQAAPQTDVRYAGALSACIVELLDNLVIQDVPTPRSRRDFIRYAARLFCDTPRGIQSVQAVLLRREGLGDTFLPPLRALLLHGKTDAVPGCRLGYLRPATPLAETGAVIEGAIVMLAPAGPEPVWQQVMQEVSAILVDRPALLDALRAGDRTDAVRLLETDLSRRFCYELSRPVPPG